MSSFQAALLFDRATDSKPEIENAQPGWFKNLPDDVQGTIKSLRSDLGELKKDVIQRFGDDKNVGDPRLPGAEADITSLLGPEPTSGSGSGSGPTGSGTGSESGTGDGTGTGTGAKDSGAKGRGLEGIVLGMVVALMGVGFLGVMM